MRTTFNIGFVCRQSKVTKSGKAPVEMSIIINGKRTYLTLPIKEDPKMFQKQVSSKKMNPIKEYLEQVYQKVVVAQTELVKNDIPVTAASLKDYIQNGCTTSYTIQDLFDEYLKILKKRVGINLTKAVYRKYEIVRNLFYSSISNTKQVTEITNGVIANFYAELNQKYESTTSASMMVKLKTIVTYALDNGKLKINPFNSIKISKRTKEVEFLTTEELQAIKSRAFSGRLEKVKDLFLFQCFTGLAYIDMANLTKEDFQFNEDQIYIKKCRVKTNITYLTVLIDEAAEIAKKYNFELPVLSNQKYNSYLKEIADLCGITKSLHTHIGRHTFATYMLNKGVSIEVVAKMLGHSNIKQTQHYSKLVDKTVFKAVQNI